MWGGGGGVRGLCGGSGKEKKEKSGKSQLCAGRSGQGSARSAAHGAGEVSAAPFNLEVSEAASWLGAAVAMAREWLGG